MNYKISFFRFIKVINFVIAVMLTVLLFASAFTPNAIAFASEYVSAVAQSQTTSAVEKQDTAEIISEESCKAEDANLSKKETAENSTVSQSQQNQTVSSSALTKANAMSVDVANVHNSTKATVTVGNFDSLAFTTCNVSATMSYDGTVTRSVTVSIASSDFNVSGTTGTSTVDFKDYGKFSVSAQLLNGTTEVASYSNTNFGVTADVYNIAFLNASLPVALETVDMWGTNSVRHEGPVICQLERQTAYDWDALPQDDHAIANRMYGMYGLPYLTYSQLKNGFDWWGRQEVIATYVKDLLSFNSNCKINLLTSDVADGCVNRIIYANDIKNYTVRLYSDGSLTYAKFASNFGSSTLEANKSILNDHVNDWVIQAKTARSTGAPTEIAKTSWSSSFSAAAAVVADENISLYVTNKSNFKSNNDNNAFGLYVQGLDRIYSENIGAKLNENIKSSTTATAELKALYKFNDNYFKKAKDAGKQVMLILGNGTDSPDLESYARMMMTYYGKNGETFFYYYKAHPGSPTSSNPGKQELLNLLEIDDVDSSIPAELIIFFNDSIKLCGYNSSVFQSIPSGMDKAMWRMSKNSGTAESAYESYKGCDFWSSEITDSTSSAIKSLCNMNDRNFLLEFNDSIISSAGNNIAIWDATTAILKYYKLSSGLYVLISTKQGVGYTSAVARGSYILNNTANKHKVIDVSGGSAYSGANVQIYDANYTGAQKWQVTVGSGGYCTIRNINSGKYLDVAGGDAANGTNVQQYDGNDTLAQKWLILASGDGYKITSAKNGEIVLDVAGGNFDNGSNVQVYTSNSSVAQTFSFANLNPAVESSSADIIEGDYNIVSSLNGLKVVDIADCSDANGANVQIYDYSENNLAQIFHISKVVLSGKTYYRIVNSYTQKALDVDSGGVIAPTNVHQWEGDTSNKNQLWSINTCATNATTYILTNVASGLTFDLAGAIINNGTNVDVYTSNGTAAQQWSLVPVNNGTLQYINGTYTIASFVDTGQVVDVSAGSLADKANVQIYSSNGTNAQKWEIVTDASTGYATIKNIDSDKYLDIAGGVISSGSNVWQYTGNDSNAQKWKIFKQSDGSYSIVSAVNNFIVLDLAGGQTSNGTNIQVYRSNATSAQLWQLQAL